MYLSCGLFFAISNLKRIISKALYNLFSRVYKKFELVLTRCVKAYSSSCSQTVILSLAISSQFILVVCAASENRKNP